MCWSHGTAPGRRRTDAPEARCDPGERGSQALGVGESREQAGRLQGGEGVAGHVHCGFSRGLPLAGLTRAKRACATSRAEASPLGRRPRHNAATAAPLRLLDPDLATAAAPMLHCPIDRL